MEVRKFSNEKVVNLARVGVLIGLYVSITLLLAPISYGVIQVRVSEMFNHLVHYNKRYLWAMTIGVFIANFFSFGAIDMIVGSLATLIFLALSMLITKNIKSMFIKQLLSSVLMAISMLMIALEIKILGIDDHSFWFLFGTMALGEFTAMFLGGFIIRFIGKRIDLTR